MPKISAREHEARMERGAARVKRAREIAKAREIIAEQFDPDRKQWVMGDWHFGMLKQEIVRNYRGGKTFRSMMLQEWSAINMDGVT